MDTCDEVAVKPRKKNRTSVRGSKAKSETDSRLFAEMNELRRPTVTVRLRKRTVVPECAVDSLYKRESLWARIAKTSYFEHVTLSIVCINAAWMGIETDYNEANELFLSHMVFILIENFFCFYFSFELIIRFLAFNKKLNCLKDSWFVFDLLLVIQMVVETWVIPLFLSGTGGKPMGGMSILRLLRLLRLTRMVRLMRAIPSMMIVIKGMHAMTRAMFYAFILLVIMLYACSILFMFFARGTPEFKGIYNGALPLVMYTLFHKGTFLDDSADLLVVLRDSSSTFANIMFYVVLLYMMGSTWLLLNMLIGVSCEVASATKEREVQHALWLTSCSELTKAFHEMDEDHTNTISQREFDQLTEKPEVLKALKNLDVEPKHLVSLSDALFEPGDGAFSGVRELTFPEFLDVISSNRPGNVASVLDMAQLTKGLKKRLSRLDTVIQRLHFYATDTLPANITAQEDGDSASVIRTKACAARQAADQAESRLLRAKSELCGRMTAEHSDKLAPPEGLQNGDFVTHAAKSY